MLIRKTPRELETFENLLVDNKPALYNQSSADLDQVVHIMNEVKKYVDRNTDIIADFEKVWAEMHVVRRDKIIEMI